MNINEKVRVLENEFARDGSSCEVVLEADTREPLAHYDAKAIAVEYAGRKGFPVHGISNTYGPYPVDANGRVPTTAEEARDLTARFRMRVVLTSGPMGAAVSAPGFGFGVSR